MPIEEVIKTSTQCRVEAVPFQSRGQGDQSSQKRILIRGGRVVNEDAMFDADIYIEEGKIKDVGPNLIVPGGVRVVEAKGQYVIPGGIDPHTHMQMPFMGTRSADDFYSGTKAALAGGTTTIIDFVIASEAGPVQSYERWRNWADQSVCCDYGLHVAICSWKDGTTDKEMATLVKEKGINSFKCFMAYKGAFMLTDEELIKVFDTARRLGALPMVHAENGEAIDFMSKKLLRLGVTGPEGHLQSRPESIEAEATHRAIALADNVGAPLYVVHVMSNSAADEVVRAKKRGAVVFGEALAAGLSTDGRHYFNHCWRHAAGHVLSPPLRTDPNTPENLMNLVSVGLLDSTGSDHCVFTSEQKGMGKTDFTKIPNGVNGVEERLSVIWEKGVKTGKLDPCKFVAATSSNAAKIFNMYPRKGRIAPGSDADVVVWGRKPRILSAETHHSLVDFNIFEGAKVEFGPLVVITGGLVVLDEDGLRVTQGHGRFISCDPYCEIVYGRLKEREENMGPIKVDRSAKAQTGNGAAGDRAIPTPIEVPIASSKQIELSMAPLHLSTSPTLSSVGSEQLTPGGFHQIQTRSGVKNLQDSTFKLTGEQIDDDRMSRTGIKVANPPGGRSSGIW